MHPVAVPPAPEENQGRKCPTRQMPSAQLTACTGFSGKLRPLFLFQLSLPRPDKAPTSWERVQKPLHLHTSQKSTSCPFAEEPGFWKALHTWPPGEGSALPASCSGKLQQYLFNSAELQKNLESDLQLKWEETTTTAAQHIRSGTPTPHVCPTRGDSPSYSQSLRPL